MAMAKPMRRRSHEDTRRVSPTATPTTRHRPDRLPNCLIVTAVIEQHPAPAQPSRAVAVRPRPRCS